MAQARRMSTSTKAKQPVDTVDPSKTIDGAVSVPQGHTGKKARQPTHRGNNENQKDPKPTLEESSHVKEHGVMVPSSSKEKVKSSALKVMTSKAQNARSVPARKGGVKYEIKISLPNTQKPPGPPRSKEVEHTNTTETSPPPAPSPTHTGEICNSPTEHIASKDGLSTTLISQSALTLGQESKFVSAPMTLYQIPAKRSQHELQEPRRSQSQPFPDIHDHQDEETPVVTDEVESKESSDSLSEATPEEIGEVRPTQPPSAASAPKRHVQLATANSNMADWFAHGTFKLKNEVKEKPQPKDTQPDPEQSSELSTPNRVESEVEITQDLLINIPEVLESSIGSQPLFPQPEFIEVKENSQVVLDGPAVVFVINRPYVKHPFEPKAADQAAAVEQLSSQTIPATSSLSPATEEEISSDDGPVIVKAANPSEEEDGLRMKWFREEIRQSPSRDGSWTIGNRPLSSTEFADHITESTSPMAAEVVVVEELPALEPIEKSTSVNIQDTPEEVSIIHATTAAQTAPCKPSENDLHIDATTVIHTIQTVKSKFVIVGGQVQRMEQPQTQTEPTSITPPHDLATEEQDLIQFVSKIPPRKALKPSTPPRTPVPQDGEESDGWSTEGEETLDPTTKEPFDAGIEETAEADSVAETTLLTTTGVERPASTPISTEIMDTPVELLDTPMRETKANLIEVTEATVQNPLLNMSLVSATPDITIESQESQVASTESTKSAIDVPPATPTKTDTKYEIVAGKVIKMSDTPKIQTEGLTSGTSSPLNNPAYSIASQPSFESRQVHRRAGSRDLHPTRHRAPYQDHRWNYGARIPKPAEPPEAALKFIQCGEEADAPTIGALVRKNAPWAGAPLHAHTTPVVVGSTGKTVRDKSVSKAASSQPASQQAMQEGPFDPFRWEPEDTLASLKLQFPPLLTSDIDLRHMLFSTPNCFCGKRCARFEGIVPVFVCGTFNNSGPTAQHTWGCVFHMHVPFWECLRDTYTWNQEDKQVTFSSSALHPHLAACPFLNFTYCVKFSQQNDVKKYLPAEIRAANTCACDQDMRLDFSNLLNQWVFSCPNFHRMGARKKCVRRVLVQETRYKLLQSSANLHGGKLAREMDMQTMEPSEHLLHDVVPGNIKFAGSDEIPGPPTGNVSGDVFSSFLPNVALSPEGAESWARQLRSINDSEESEWRRGLLNAYEKMREHYSWLEKQYDDLACEKIRAEEQHRREEQAARLKSNVVTCLACCEATAMCVFIPCFHMVMCEKCSGKGRSIC